MIKYFIITHEKYKQEYEKYRRDFEKFNNIFDIMQKEFGIETTRYYPTLDMFGIDPTPADLEKFKSDMKKEKEFFKKNSKQSKRWVELIKEHNITCNHVPEMTWDYIDIGCGRVRSSVVEIKSVIYGTLEYDKDFVLPEGFNEIKASEYHRILEENNIRI